ncbi:MAG: (2Fe-2S)-binding protein [Halobacteriota archaeon]
MEIMRTKFRVNGKDIELDVEPRRLLVSVLREELGLTGTHIGCDTTNCGACAVVVDGKAIKSCTMLAIQADGKDILTIEGLTKDGTLHAVQRAFLEKHGLQCGFCTPGMIVMSYWLLNQNQNQNQDWSEEEIKKRLSGNLCRCTGYRDILASIRYAKELMKEERE